VNRFSLFSYALASYFGPPKELSNFSLLFPLKHNTIIFFDINCCSIDSTCYCECEILSASVPSRASNNETVRNRVSNLGNLFHLVKCHSISRHLYKETVIMNKLWCFLFLLLIIENMSKWVLKQIIKSVGSSY